MFDDQPKVKTTFLHRHTWTLILVLILAVAKLGTEFIPELALFKNQEAEKKWMQFLEHIFISSIVLLVFRLIYKFTSNRVAAIFDEQEERLFYSKIYGWILFAIGAFTVLNLFGLSLNNITLFVGIITTGLAFALREVLLSFIGWLVLLRKKPFRIGDHIRIGDESGKVIHIGTYYVILDKTTDIPDDYTRIPNRFFLEKSIDKFGKSQSHENIQVRVIRKPENKKDKIESLKTKMLALNSELNLISVNLDIQRDHLYLVVNFLTPFEGRFSWRDKVIELLLEEFDDAVYFPKD